MTDLANPKDMLGVKKVPLASVPPSLEIYAALSLWHGSVKYFRFNYRHKKVVGSIYLDALKRHIKAYEDGEWLTRDSKLPHLSGAAACLAILIDGHETGMLIDDRPPPGTTGDLLEHWNKEVAENLLPKWEAERAVLEKKMGKKFKKAATK